MQPVNYDPTKVNNGGSTVPIKLTLCSTNGTNLSSGEIVLHAIKLVNVATGAEAPVADSGNANSGGNFRYGGGGYIFNLNTKGLSAGTWQLVVTATGDNVPHILTCRCANQVTASMQCRGSGLSPCTFFCKYHSRK